MSSIDERVVAMKFDNAKFEAGVAKTMATLTKLDTALKKIGTTHVDFSGIQKSADKINFKGLSDSLDSIKAKLNFGREAQNIPNVVNAANKSSFAPLSSAIDSIKSKFATITGGASAAIDAFKSKLQLIGGENGFIRLRKAADNVKLDNIAKEADNANRHISELGGNRAFTAISTAASRVTLGTIGAGVDALNVKFSALQVAATTALGTIVSRITSSSATFAKGLTIGPIVDGLREYTTNLNSIQTILANTQASGAGLKDVNKALQELNHYSDQTIYNFSQMAQNIGTFTAAGVDLDTATASIKGIANLAALSGSNSQQAATAMYQLSQAISAGRVSLEDWNSVVNAGMGGTVFQRALAQTAEQLGTIKKGAVELKGPMKNVTIEGKSFRESITAKPGEKSWLTSDVLTKTLQQFTGDLSDAQLKAMGFNDQQIKSIQQTAKTAKAAATEVKSLGQVFDVARETVGSGWSQTFQLIFGDFGEAKKFFTGMSNGLNGFINASSDARNKILKDWKELGGRDVLIQGLKNAISALKSVLDPLHDAFREIFPATTGKNLLDITKKFRDFMAALKIGPETGDKLKRTFAGFFAILDIGKQIVSGVISVIGDLFSSAGKGSGGFLEITASVGDWLVSLDKAIKQGHIFEKFFDGLGKVLSVPIKLLGNLGDAIANLFSGGKSSEGFSKSLDGMNKSLGPLQSLAHGAESALKGLFSILGKVKDALGPVAGEIADVFGDVGNEIADAINNADLSGVFAAINTTLIGGILLTLKRSLGKGISNEFNFDLGGGALRNISKSFDVLNGSLTTIQNNIKAGTLLKIASAVAVLSAAVVALSLIDPKKLSTAMTGVATGMGLLVGSMKLLTTGAGFAAFAKMPFISAGLIGLAAAVDVLSIAVIALSRLSWDEIARGLSAVGGALVAIAAGVRAIPPTVLVTGAALIPLAVGLNILAGAVKIFSTMDWGEIAKGLAGVGGGLAAIGIGTKAIGPSVIPAALAIIPLATGLGILAGAIRAFGGMDLKSLGKGLLGVGSSLIVVGLAINAIPLTAAVQGAGLLVVAAGLSAMAGAIALMGGMKIATIAKGLAAIGASLVVLAGGLTLMSGTLAGSASLFAAASALAILTPVLGVLGNMKWTTIAKGLGAIAASLVTIGAVGLVAAPGLTAVGLAMVGLGAGIAAAGLGVNLLAKGLKILGSDGAKGVGIMVAALTGLVAILPKVVIDFAKGIVEIVKQVALIAPTVTKQFVTIVNALLQGVIDASPKLAEAVIALLAAFLKVVNDKAPEIIESGFKLLVAFLKGIKDHIGEVITTTTQVITTVLTNIARSLPKIIAAGAQALLSFLKGITQQLPAVLKSATDVVVKFVSGLTNAVPKVVPAVAALIAKFLSSVASHASEVISAGAKLIANIITGIGNNIGRLTAAAANMIGKFFDAVVKAAIKLENAGAKAVINFINGTANAIRAHSGELGEAGANLGTAIVEGMIRGLGSMAGALASKVTSLIGSIPGKAKKLLGIGSPSKVFAEIGVFTIQGFVNGINSMSPDIGRSAEAISNGFINGVKDVFQIQSPSKVMESIGKFVTEGFSQGLLKGTQEDVKTALDDLQSKVSSAMTDLRSTLEAEQAKRTELLSATKKDKDAIEKVNDSIKANNEALKQLKSTHTLLTEGFKKQKSDMLDLVKQYTEVTTKLNDAKTALADAQKVRDDAVASFTDQYATLPSLNAESENQLGDYTVALQNQVNAVAAYQGTLEQLRKIGLDDATYQKLLKEGPADQAFANQLLAGGRTAVEGLNALDAQLQSVSRTLATQAATNLYQAGVDAAQGLVNGLISQQSGLYKAMEKLAESMIKAIKKRLHIKSPSREFAEIGKFSILGLIRGFDESSSDAVSAASGLGDKVVSAMQDSLSKVNEALPNELDMNPTITPVLDLTNVQKEAKKLDTLTNVTPISAAASFGQASLISLLQEQAAQAAATEEMAKPTTTKDITFIQNNTSPEALSHVDIYRQTRNQLSQAKNALGVA